MKARTIHMTYETMVSRSIEIDSTDHVLIEQLLGMSNKSYEEFTEEEQKLFHLYKDTYWKSSDVTYPDKLRIEEEMIDPDDINIVRG